MKKLYFVLSFLSLSIAKPAFSQQWPVNPLSEGPTLTKLPTKLPWLGVSVSIPLRKLFGKKSTVHVLSSVSGSESAPVEPPATTNDIVYVYDPDCACFVIQGGEVKAPKNEQGFGDPGNAGGGPYPTDPNAPPRPTSPGDTGGGDTQPSTLPKPLVNAKKSAKADGCNTFKSMWDRQNNDRHVEQLALVTDKGIFWLDDADNFINSSETGAPSEYSGPAGQKYFIKDGASSRDINSARDFGVPMYIIADEGISKVLGSGSNQGIIDYNTNNIFDCSLDQNVIEELR